MKKICWSMLKTMLFPLRRLLHPEKVFSRVINNTDVMEVPEKLVVVRGVSHNEVIGHFKSEKIRPVTQFPSFALLCVFQQKTGNKKSRGFVLVQSSQQSLHCSP